MFKNILHSLVTRGLVAVVNFLILIVSARYLGVSSRGDISLFILNLSIIQIVNEVYTGYTLVYFVPKFNLRKLFFAGLVYTLVFCSLSNMVIVFINKQVPGFGWLGYLISLLIIINTFNCVLILGKEKVSSYNFLNLLQPALLLLGLGFYIFVLKDMTFAAYVYPLLISFVVSTVISAIGVLQFVFKNNAGKPFELRPILVNGFLCQAGILMHIFCNRYSYYLLSSNDRVGLYSSASSLIESVLIIANGISPVLLARVANQGNNAKSTEMTLSLSKASLLFSILAVLVICALPEQLFVWLLGSGFAGTKQLMLLYAPGILMVSLFGIITNFFSAIGKLKIVLLCNSVGFILTITLAPFLIGRFDVDGAAYTADIAYLAIAVGVYVAFFKISHLPFKRLFSVKQDFQNLKALIKARQD